MRHVSVKISSFVIPLRSQDPPFSLPPPISGHPSRFQISPLRNILDKTRRREILIPSSDFQRGRQNSRSSGPRLIFHFLILQETQDTLDKGHGTQRIRDFKEKMYPWPWDQSMKCRCNFLLARSPRLLMDIHRWGMSNVVLGVLVPCRFFKNRIRVYFGG